MMELAVMGASSFARWESFYQVGNGTLLYAREFGRCDESGKALSHLIDGGGFQFFQWVDVRRTYDALSRAPRTHSNGLLRQPEEPQGN
jgi:hypothetical protein